MRFFGIIALSLLTGILAAPVAVPNPEAYDPPPRVSFHYADFLEMLWSFERQNLFLLLKLNHQLPQLLTVGAELA
jgi:hypothetical protein